MNSYESYKNLDSFWYIKVPNHWIKTKNKFIFKEDKVVVGDNWSSYQVLTMGKSGVKPRDMEAGGKFPGSYETYQTVKTNQIIFCLFDIDETPRTVGISQDEGMITSAYTVLSVLNNNDPNYWNYFYQHIDNFKSLKPFYTGLRKVVRSDTFMSIDIYQPPLNEQKLISQYLNKKIKQIDTLINKTREKIELLKEQKLSLINKLLTKGLDNSAEFKNSGFDSIGQIPKNWKLGKLKYVSSLITKGTTPSNIGEDYSDSSEVRFLKGEDINDGEILVEGKTFISKEVDEKLKRSQLKAGDLLVVIAGTLGKSAIVKNEILPANTNQAISLVRFRNNIHPKFFQFWFETASCKKQISESAVITAQPNLSMEDLGNIIVPIIDFSTQKQISDSLLIFTERVNKIIQKEQSRIKLYLEYQKSLLSFTLTGKFKITESSI
jgi:type I restriction enzyme S subunit